eukprot:gene2298-2471_t
MNEALFKAMNEEFPVDEMEKNQTNEKSSGGSIWDLDIFEASPFDKLIEDQASFEDIIDTDKLVQEVKAEHEGLLKFLSKDENIKLIIQYLVTITTVESNKDINEKNEKELHKYPYVCCEIILCNIKMINEKIINNNDILKKLFHFLEDRKIKKEKYGNLNTSHDFYFSKVFKHFLKHNYIEITNFLIKNELILLNLISNFDIYNFDDIFLRIIGLSQKEQINGSNMTEEKLRELFIMSKKNDLNEELKQQIETIQEWIIEKNVILNLIEELKINNSDIHSNIFNLFEEILNKSPNSNLSMKIQSKDVIEIIFNILFKFKYISLFKYSNQYFNTIIKYLLDSNFDEKEEEEEEDNILNLILNSNDSYFNILFKNEALMNSDNVSLNNQIINTDTDNSTNIITTTIGDIKSFGELKLEMIEYYLNLSIGSCLFSKIDITLSKSLNSIFNLFSIFPFNNILHVKILNIFKNILKYKYGSEESKRVIFEDVKIIDKIIKNENQNLKIFYFQIANLILDISTSDKLIESYLKDNQEWKMFVTNQLSEFNKIMSKDIGGEKPHGKGISSSVMLALSKEDKSINDDDDDDEIEQNDHYSSDEDDDDREPTSILKTNMFGGPGDEDDDFDADFDYPIKFFIYNNVFKKDVIESTGSNESDVFTWDVYLEGPSETPYENGIFKLQFKFPADYPYSPPTLSFISNFWHPNVYEDGKVCISILHPSGDDPMSGERPEERWLPTQSPETVLLSVQSSPANVDASVQWRKDKEGFEKKIKNLIEAAKDDLPQDFVMPYKTFVKRTIDIPTLDEILDEGTEYEFEVGSDEEYELEESQEEEESEKEELEEEEEKKEFNENKEETKQETIEENEEKKRIGEKIIEEEKIKVENVNTETIKEKEIIQNKVVAQEEITSSTKINQKSKDKKKCILM